jgi:hypothetical protein
MPEPNELAPLCDCSAMSQGAKKYILEHDKSWTQDKAAWVSAICAGGLTVLSAIAMIPLIYWMENKHFG